MFYYKSYKMSADTSPSPTRKLNVIQSVEDLNNVYFKCSKRLNKGKPVAGGTTYYEITCTTADGTPIMNTNIEIANVPVRGVTMPFYRKTKANCQWWCKGSSESNLYVPKIQSSNDLPKLASIRLPMLSLHSFMVSIRSQSSPFNMLLFQEVKEFSFQSFIMQMEPS